LPAEGLDFLAPDAPPPSIPKAFGTWVRTLFTGAAPQIKFPFVHFALMQNEPKNQEKKMLPRALVALIRLRITLLRREQQFTPSPARLFFWPSLLMKLRFITVIFENKRDFIQ
jgi:hypothetical protein